VAAAGDIALDATLFGALKINYKTQFNLAKIKVGT